MSRAVQRVITYANHLQGQIKYDLPSCLFQWLSTLKMLPLRICACVPLVPDTKNERRNESPSPFVPSSEMSKSWTASKLETSLILFSFYFLLLVLVESAQILTKWSTCPWKIAHCSFPVRDWILFRTFTSRGCLQPVFFCLQELCSRSTAKPLSLELVSSTSQTT
jgi:hypothetical protein